jgi:hypothetical protein
MLLRKALLGLGCIASTTRAYDITIDNDGTSTEPTLVCGEQPGS